MAIKTYKPTTPSRRHMTVSAFEGIDKKAKPERKLTEVLKKNAGRNSYGRITVRHHGGGNKQKYRIIDFKRDKTDMFATVLRLEYDPNRSAYIALVEYEDGERRYVIAPVGLTAGDKIISSASADIKPGNCLPIANIPVGTVIHNIEMHPGKGAQLVRSAGAAAQLMAKENGDAQIRMPSGEVRIVRTNLPYASPEFAPIAPDVAWRLSLCCLENARDILLALEAEYRFLYARNLTLNRLSEAVILPLYPDKGGCMTYDLSRTASTYLEEDIELLKRVRPAE